MRVQIEGDYHKKQKVSKINLKQLREDAERADSFLELRRVVLDLLDELENK